ncbi:hypothetical protein GcC1_022007 [Golovinomyces cichoracearum]|uniref:Uncharacterized protein n=1 Tax=Golovinomyces cichoracearum TaxID=62708 RepID=A0A420J4L9_9PEZI|nr:hypothetical protein GcC1_022007 [Golovinomyces cichoracearum]
MEILICAKYGNFCGNTSIYVEVTVMKKEKKKSGVIFDLNAHFEQAGLVVAVRFTRVLELIGILRYSEQSKENRDPKN